MLTDKSFRRTVQCSKYAQLVQQKDRAPLVTPFRIQAIHGHSLTEESLNENGLDVPVVIKASEQSCRHLGLKLPPPDTTLSDIAETLGRDFPVKVIEVGAQHEIEGFTIGDYADYLEGRTSMHKLLNMISLEVSTTVLSCTVLSPRAVRQVDWIDCYWSQDRRSHSDFPRVQKYVLAGMAGSYTDFHVDFGGTSVWYHVIRGCKVFYLIPPSPENLRAYAAWIRSANQDSTFFPETLSQLGECKKVTITAGDTLMIPGGWIHAVFTPEDSLVMGGNFLFSAAIVPQLQVYSVEHRTRVSQKYRFPFFRQMAWYVLCRILPIEMKRQGQLQNVVHSTNSDGESSDSSDDEEDDESSLKHTRVAWGWPYLVKMVAVWIAEGLPAADQTVYDEVALKCLDQIGKKCTADDSPTTAIIDTWWDILRTLPMTLETPTDNKFINYDKHLSKIRSYENTSTIFDVLDESLYEFFPFVNKAPGFYTPLQLTNDDIVQSTDIPEIKSEVVTSVDNSENTKVVASSPSMKLSLKLSRGGASRDALPSSSTSDFAPTTDVSDLVDDTTRLPTPEKRTAKLVFKLKPEVSVTASGSGEGAWGHTSSSTITNNRSRAARSFGTRGKRLSADFLQNASDFDIGGGDDEHANDDTSDLDDNVDNNIAIEDEFSKSKRLKVNGLSSEDEEDYLSDVEDEEEQERFAQKKKIIAAKTKPEAKPKVKPKPKAPKGASSLLKERLKRKFR